MSFIENINEYFFLRCHLVGEVDGNVIGGREKFNGAHLITRQFHKARPSPVVPGEANQYCIVSKNIK